MATFNGMECKVLGKMEAERPCDCCGTNLLKTAVVIELENGTQLQVGRDCAAKAIHGRKTSANARKIDQAASNAEHEANCLNSAKMARIAEKKNEANHRFNATGRPVAGSFFAINGGNVVRVDGSDAVDVQWFADQGFVQDGPVVPAGV